jgi:hypothetical protein
MSGAMGRQRGICKLDNMNTPQIIDPSLGQPISQAFS